MMVGDVWTPSLFSQIHIQVRVSSTTQVMVPEHEHRCGDGVLSLTYVWLTMNV